MAGSCGRQHGLWCLFEGAAACVPEFANSDAFPDNYEAPECINEDRASLNSDSFSLAAITYHVLTGEHGFDEVHGSRRDGVAMGKRRPAHPIWSKMPDAFERALDPDPGKRPTVEELVADLEY